MEIRKIHEAIEDQWAIGKSARGAIPPIDIHALNERVADLDDDTLTLVGPPAYSVSLDPQDTLMTASATYNPNLGTFELVTAVPRGGQSGKAKAGIHIHVPFVPNILGESTMQVRPVLSYSALSYRIATGDSFRVVHAYSATYMRVITGVDPSGAGSYQIQYFEAPPAYNAAIGEGYPLEAHNPSYPDADSWWLSSIIRPRTSLHPSGNSGPSSWMSNAGSREAALLRTGKFG